MAARRRGADVLRRLHADPAFAAARDQRGRERFQARQLELQRKARAARRGVDVPPDLEKEWRRLTNRRRKGALSHAEAAAVLGLSYNPKGSPSDE